MNNLVIKKCMKCGAVVKVINDCSCNDCGIKCCSETMDVLEANKTDASFEKHIPTYEIKDDKIIVTVNHAMEDEHFIEWISFVSDNKEQLFKLNPNDEAKCIFKYIPNSTIYSYCNKHGLWKIDVK